MGELHPTAEAREIDNRSPTPGDLGGDKEATVKPWGRRRNLDDLLLHQGGHRVRQSQPPDGIGAGSGKGERNRGERGPRTERDPIPVAQDLDYPSIGSSRLPDLPIFARHPPTLRDEGHGSYLRKPLEGFRAEEGAGESNLTLLDEREGEPDSLRRRREGEERGGERAGLNLRCRGPERLEATSSSACCKRREDDVCVSDNKREMSDSANKESAQTRGAANIAHLWTSEKYAGRWERKNRCRFRPTNAV